MAKAYIHVEWAARGLPAGPPKPSFETRSAHGMALINKVVTLESFLVSAVVPPHGGACPLRGGSEIHMCGSKPLIFKP